MGKIQRDQVEGHAAWKGMTAFEVEKRLGLHLIYDPKGWVSGKQSEA